MRFWRELYASVDENQVFAAVRLPSVDVIKETHMDFLEDAKAHSSTRTLDQFSHGVHREAGRMETLQELMQFKRLPDWGVRVFGKNIPV